MSRGQVGRARCAVGATIGVPWRRGTLALVSVLLLPELVLWGADLGLWGSAAWRPLALQYGAFWGGLLRDWQPNYALQPLLMFVTYALLHAGPGHLLGNLLVLAPLLDAVAGWLGGRRAALVGLAAVVGGAAAFGLLAPDPSPMVGASGLAFGLAGALVSREAARPGGGRRAALMALGLAALNLAAWLLLERVAWQTHAGGSLAGAAAAWALHRPGGPSPGPPGGYAATGAGTPSARAKTLS